MSNINLLSSILKKTNSLIKSNEYKEKYKLGNSFVRNRKLSFTNTVYFICSALRKSLSTEFSSFIDKHHYLSFPDISKQGLSKARQNISPEAFKSLCKLAVESFYNSKTKLSKWHGFNVFAIDGSSVEVPDLPQCIEYFGTSLNQSKVKTAVVTTSALFDVLNDMVIDCTIRPFRTSETLMAKEHINSITNPTLLNKSIVLFDRGYPSYELCDFLEKKSLYFLMRTPSSFKRAHNTPNNDDVIEYKIHGNLKKLRVIKVQLPDGTIEVLITNIFDTKLSIRDFKELYFLRWGIESKYRELKSSIDIEQFSGAKPITIEQDFYVSIYLSMLSCLIKNEADASIAKATEGKNLKFTYQANRSFIIGEVFRNIIKMMLKPRFAKECLKSILEKAKKNRSQIRPNRSCSEKSNIQGKSTIIILNPVFNIKNKYVI